jgi:membrane-bound ClpP family serine protease
VDKIDAWIKIFVVLVMLSALSLVVGYIIHDPFVGLILLAVILTLLVVTVEPATGKAMAQVTIPIVIILFVFQIVLNPTFQFEIWMLVIVGAILYLMFTLFTGGGALEGSLIDAKMSLKLFPIYALAILLASIADPSHRTTAVMMAVTIGGMMVLYMVFLRDYDEWPEVTYGPNTVIAMTDLDPRGKVKTGGEVWWARATDPPIRAGENVLVRGVSGVTMIVSRDKDDQDLEHEATND